MIDKQAERHRFMQLTNKDNNHARSLLKTVFENSTDPREASTLVGSLYRPHNLSLRQPTDSMSARMAHFDAVETSISQLTYDAEIRITSDPFQDFYLVMLPKQGQFSVTQNRSELIATVDSPIVLDADKSIDMNWSKSCDNLIFKVNKRLIEKSLFDSYGIEAKHPVEFNFAHSKSANLQNFAALFSSLMHNNPYFDESHKNPEVLKKIEELLVAALISSGNNYSQVIEGIQYKVLPKFVIHAKDFIEENYANKITVIDVAQFVGVSVRALQKGFEQYENSTPSLFLRRIRLRKARETLLKMRCNPNALKVSEVALNCGFQHFGNFSNYYLKEYGESPSTTLSGKTR